MLKPFQFPDFSGRLFGRKKDVANLLECVRKPGITFITARPRMGKTWLLLEVGRQLSASDDCLVGYFEAKGGTELIQRAVIDLYIRWISTTSFSEHAKIFWEQNRGSVLPRVAKALGSAFEKIGELPLGGIEKVAVLIADGFNSLAEAQRDLETGRMQYEPLPYEVVQDLLFIVDKVDNNNRKLVLILDAWDQSDAITKEKRTLEAIAKNINDTEVWSCCHLLMAVKHPELDDQRARPAYEAARQLSNYDTAHLYELKRMRMDEQEKQKRFNLHEKVPILNQLPLERIEKLHHGYPGVIESWRKHADEISSEQDLQRFAQEALALEYSEFDKLLPSLEGDELLWAIRIAFFRRLDSDSWKIYQDILSDGIDDNLWKKLFRMGVLESKAEERPAGADYFPTYGHETRHHRVRLWFLERHMVFGPEICEEITRLCFAIASKVQKVDPVSHPYGAALLEYLSKYLKPVVSEDAYALAYSSACIFGIRLEFFDLSSVIPRLIARDPRTKVLISSALINRGFMHGKQGDNEKAIADYTTVFEMPEVPSHQVAEALINRGAVYGDLDKHDKAEADFLRVIEMTDAPVNKRSIAFINLGLTIENQIDSLQETSESDEVKELREEAIGLYSQVIKMTNASVEYRSRALFNRSLLYGQQNHTNKAIKDYTAVIAMFDAPQERRLTSFYNRGILHTKQGDTDAAIADYTKVIEMPGAPFNLRNGALINRSHVFIQLGNMEAAIADCTEVIDIPDVTQKQKAEALHHRGKALIERSKTEVGCADLRNALSLYEEHGIKEDLDELKELIKKHCTETTDKLSKRRKRKKDK